MPTLSKADFPSLIAEAAAHAKAGRVGQARACLAPALKVTADAAPAQLRALELLARYCIRDDAFPDAEEAIRTLEEQAGGAAPAWIRVAAGSLNNAPFDIALADGLSVADMRQAARFAADHKDFATAAHLFERLSVAEPDKAMHFMSAVDMLSAIDPSEAERFVVAQAEAGKLSIPVAQRLGRLVNHGALGRTAFLKVVEVLLSKSPDDADLRELHGRLSSQRSPNLMPDDDPAAQLEVMKAEAARRSEVSKAAARRLHALEKLSGADMYRRVINDYDGAEVAQSPRVEGGNVLVRFAGLAEPGNLHFLDALASAAGLNAIYLKDPQRLFFCNGLPSLGGFDETIGGLRGMIDGYGEGKTLTMLGSSAGGYAALLYGTHLKADRVIGLSAPTTARRDISSQMHDRRARAVLHRLEQKTSEEIRDLKLQLSLTGHTPRMDLIFGSGNAVDRAHAEYMADVPGVTLFPLADFDGHNTIAYLTELGVMPDILTDNMSALAPFVERS